MTGDEILTVAEVAVELRCSKAHVYNAIAGKVDGWGMSPAGYFHGTKKAGPPWRARTVEKDE